MSAQRTKVFEYVDSLRLKQERKHGDHAHSIPEWILIARRQLQKAEDAWYEGYSESAVQHIGEAAASAVAGMEQHADDVSLTPL